MPSSRIWCRASRIKTDVPERRVASNFSELGTALAVARRRLVSANVEECHLLECYTVFLL